MQRARTHLIVSHGAKAETSRTFLPGDKVPEDIAQKAAPGSLDARGDPAPSVPLPKAPAVIQTPPANAEKGQDKGGETPPATAGTAPAVPPVAGQAPDLNAGKVQDEPAKPKKADYAGTLPTTKAEVLALRKPQAQALCAGLGIEHSEDEKLPTIQARIIRELGITG